VEIFAISDTGGKFAGVTTTLVENLPPISTTPSANFANGTTGVIDTGGKFQIESRKLAVNLPPVSSTPVVNHWNNLILLTT
jgi:hypothetical protein